MRFRVDDLRSTNSFAHQFHLKRTEIARDECGKLHLGGSETIPPGHPSHHPGPLQHRRQRDGICRVNARGMHKVRLEAGGSALEDRCQPA